MRAILVLMSAAMMVTLGASALASAPTQPTSWFVGEDAAGNVVVIPWNAVADHQTECGGLAPTVTSCSSGPHTPLAGPTSYLHGFRFDPCVAGMPTGCFFGAASSTISDGVNTRTFTCSALLGLTAFPGGVGVPGALGCSGVGVKPSGTFNQVCKTYFNAAANAVEGGVGAWVCTVTGNNGYPAP